MRLLAIGCLFIFYWCNSLDRQLLNDSRFSSGREYETQEKIKPKLFHSGSYTLIIGFDETNRATLGLYLGQRELLYQTNEDGSFDTVVVANLNGDDIDEFVIRCSYEDGPSLLALTSASQTAFKLNLLRLELKDCEVGSDTSQHILPLQIADINKDGRDDILINSIKFENKATAISCTDTILSSIP